ncbi:MAG: hypothetical protein R3332_01720 [Pseudohongiellaceae bacterium]|nr:hypothetical protein [Pseudohongiellaceae bacterium]
MKSKICNVLDTIAIVFVYLILVLSDRLNWIRLDNLLYFPLELMLIGAILLIPFAKLYIRGIVAVLLGLGLVFRLADISAFEIFARSFNPVFDAYLLLDGYGFVRSSFGTAAALLTAVLLLVLIGLIFYLSYWALGRIARLVNLSHKRSVLVLLPTIILWTVLYLGDWPRASMWFIDQFSAHMVRIAHSVKDIREFRSVVDADPYAEEDGLFDRLAGKDVLIVFIESYGRTLLEKTEYSPQIRTALEEATANLKSHGFSSRSALLHSPTVGGISWLAHATALSGLWIDSQVRYDSLLLSDRETLLSLFERSGWRSVGVMPAISMAWPEGSYFGYDSLLAAPQLNYRGEPFNYVTMPDQFTLAQFQALERGQARQEQPLVAEIALLSSHAPWTPVPYLIDWDEVGDGTVFNEQALSGEPPEVVWQDKERVMRQYRESVEYVLNTLVSYIKVYGDEDLVVLILGDHQPMPYVTDNSPSRDVPVHIIARDSTVMSAIEHWQWQEGMLPSLEGPVWRMDALRDEFIQAFSSELPQD